MAKTCLCEGCNRPQFGGKYCSYHQNMRSDETYLRSKAKREAKAKEKKKSIPRQSKKQKERDVEYSSKVHKWKEDHPICEVEGCGAATDDLHHKIGKGIHTNNDQYFMALCRFHHRLCKESPLLAQKLGLIITRTINRKHEY